MPESTVGGNATVTAATTGVTAAGAITTTGRDDVAQGTAGGEILLRSTGPAPARYKALTANGDTAGPNGGGAAGLVTVFTKTEPLRSATFLPGGAGGRRVPDDTTFRDRDDYPTAGNSRSLVAT
jgi:hypothetical protein